MSKIKTRDNIKDIKVLNVTGELGRRMKNAYIRTKGTADNTSDDNNRSPEDYAEEKIGSAEQEAVHMTLKNGEKAVRKSYEAYKKIKTAKSTAKKAEKTSKTTVKTARKSAQTAKVTAKTAVESAKFAAKAIAATVKAAGEAIEGIVASIGAGSVSVIIIVVIVGIVGLIVGSEYGIFFSGQSNGSNNTMFRVIREINDDYLDRIESIKATVNYDDLEITGSRAPWKEVLSVYAVKTTTSENGEDVASVTDDKKQILLNIFNDMNVVSYYTSTYTETGYDEDRNEITIYLTRLHIETEGKTADVIANEYGFSLEQKTRMNELLSEEYDELRASVLYGIDSADNAIVAVALSQIGNVGGEPYWSWYGYRSHVDWCACFVSWCANECGYIDDGSFPKFSSCRVGIDWFKSHNQWMEPDVEPLPGMIIFFDWDKDGIGQDGAADHVGIVEKVENGHIYTIEGNSGDTCRECAYPLGWYEIYGYGLILK